MARPPLKISLVTTCFNAAAHIAEAIESAAGQGYPNLQHVVADAASDDGTRDVLGRYWHLVVDSRPDRGIYDGMNRGLALVTGDIVGLLNADDHLEPGALAEVAAAFASDPTLDMLTGAARVRGETGGPDIVYVPQGQPSFAGVLFGVPAINARFFAKRFLDAVGPFELALPAAADRAWLLRAVASSPRCATTQRVLYTYRAHAGSTTLAGSRSVGLRLWREHVAMADAVLAVESCPPDLRRVARQWRAVEVAKLALKDDSSGGRPLTRLRRAMRDDHGVELRDLAAGMVAWRRWRGRHADSGI